MLFFCIFVFSMFVDNIFSANPQDCFSTTDMNSLIKCLQQFIAKKESISNQVWNNVVPSHEQREAWKKVIGDLLNSDINCEKISMPVALVNIYKINKFTDGSKSYCVLYETQLVAERFAKGWGIFMVPHLSRSSNNSVHISAAHPLSDGPVHLQATNIFHRTNSRSLLIQGQDRFASMIPSTCEKSYMRTDGAHDNNTMFHAANLAISEWQMKQAGGCNVDRCSFVQFHGKATSACPSSTIFLSAGPGDSSSSLEYYKNQQLPVRRLQSALRLILPQRATVNTPLEDKICDLTAGSNIFGRVLNGVSVGMECKNGANIANVKGYFIHAEQSMIAREPSMYDGWSDAITKTFG